MKTDYIKRDQDHSWCDVDDAMDDLHDVLEDVVDQQWEMIDNRLPEYLLVREIYFLADRCEEMNKKSRGWFYAFLRAAMGARPRDRYKVGTSKTAHTLYLASLLFPILIKTKATFADIERLIPTAKRELDSCRPRVLSSDFITERDLPLMRGELLELVLQTLLRTHDGDIPRRSDDPEFCFWMGTHLDEVIEVVPALIERGSIHPALIRELVENGANPLIDGML